MLMSESLPADETIIEEECILGMSNLWYLCGESVTTMLRLLLLCGLRPHVQGDPVIHLRAPGQGVRRRQRRGPAG